MTRGSDAGPASERSARRHESERRPHAAIPGDGLQEEQVWLLLEEIHRCYGVDLKGYAAPTLKRRIATRIQKEGLSDVLEFLERVLHDEDCFNRLLGDLSITVSAMFRDPTFFAAFRKEVVPVLRTYPFVRIWDVGCGRGEEVYSLAIVLREEGLYDRCLIYATDLNEMALREAQNGIFPIGPMQNYTRNYIAAGGTGSFSEYYTARYEHVAFRSWLKSNLVFSRHNLATDGPFNEFHVIMCRNVMIYFSRPLQARVHDLLHSSLVMLGFLGLGRQESLSCTPRESCYVAVNKEERIYKRIK